MFLILPMLFLALIICNEELNSKHRTKLKFKSSEQTAKVNQEVEH